MANIKIAYDNAIDDATLTGDAASGYPVTNLANNNISNVWRPGSKAAFNGFRFKLAKVTLACCVAMSYFTLGTLGAQTRIRGGTASFDIDFTDGAAAYNPLTAGYFAQGAGTNFTGGYGGYYVGPAGVLIASSAPGHMRILCDPYGLVNGVLNSEDMTQWTQQQCQALDAQTVAFPMAVSQIYSSSTIPITAGSYTVSGWLRLLNGDGRFSLVMSDGTTEQFGATKTATSDWQRFSSTFVVGITTLSLTGMAGVFKTANTAGIMQIKGMQIESSAVMGPYRKTTTTRIHKALGLLREPARTNICLQASAFGTAPWGLGAATISADATTSPAGTLTADKLIATATTAPHYDGQAVTITAATNYTASIFVKQGETGNVTHAQLWWDNNASTAGCYMNVRLSDGVITKVATAVGGCTNVFGSVEAAPNGFWRIILTGNITTGTAGRIGLAMLNTANAATAGIAPSLALTVADFTYLWNAQVELGQGATSTINTTTLAVARTQDVITTGAFAGFNPIEGTLYVESKFTKSALIGATAQNETGIVTNAGLTSQYLLRAESDPAAPYVDATSTNGWDGTNITAGVTPLASIKQALRYRVGDSANSVNGATASTNAGALAAGMDRLIFSAYGGSGSILCRATYWPVGYDNTTMNSITTSGPSAVELDTGWVDALQMTFSNGDAPTDWGHVYDIMHHFANSPLLYGTVEVYDPSAGSTPLVVDGTVGNGANYLDLGRVFINRSSFQPTVNADWGLQSAWKDPSLINTTMTNKKSQYVLPKQRIEAFDMSVLSITEGDKWHELMGDVGLTEEVVYMRDTDDLPTNQRYGMLGQLQALNPLKYPQWANKASAAQVEKKM